MTTQHHHQWVAVDDQPGQYACTDCPATARQCRSCPQVLDTAGRTCEDCVSRARNDLRDIHDLYRQLPDVIAAAAGLHAVRYDQRGGAKTRSTDTTIIGGAALVMAAGGATYTHLARGETSDTIATLLEAERHDPPSVLAVLTGWEDAWRTEQHQHAAERTSTAAAIKYLILHTTWAAQHSPTWDTYRADIRNLRGRLWALTGRSNAPEKSGVPCPYCAGTIIQTWSSSGLDDTRRCDTCGITWASEAHFMLAIREAHQALPDTHPDQLVTLDDAKRIYKGRVRPNRFDLWVGRGTLRPAVDETGQPRRDVRGQVLYRLGHIGMQIDTGEATA